MRKFMTIAAITMIVALTGISNAHADTEKKIHAVIMLDTSGSNPIIMPDGGQYAVNVAMMFDKRLPKLTAYSLVSFETFGEHDVKKQIRKELVVSIKNRPEKVRHMLKALIKAIPSYVKSKKIAIQRATNIVASLHDLGDRLRCGEYNTHVFVLTDAIESSVYGSMPPKQKSNLFKGCKSIHFIGVTGRDAKHTKRLKSAWKTWSKRNGFEQAYAIR